MSPLYVLMYHPKADGPGRMVEVRPEPMVAPDPAYRVAYLQASARVMDWVARGARFDLSTAGAIRVWQGTRLVAAEAPSDGPRALRPMIAPILAPI